MMKDCFSVISGGIKVAETVTSQRFDYIFFTGGGSVAKKVMIKAAEYLTPVTLELGGKRYIHLVKCYVFMNIMCFCVLHANFWRSIATQCLKLTFFFKFAGLLAIGCVELESVDNFAWLV